LTIGALTGVTWRDGRVQIQVVLPACVQTGSSIEIAEPA